MINVTKLLNENHTLLDTSQEYTNENGTPPTDNNQTPVQYCLSVSDLSNEWGRETPGPSVELMSFYNIVLFNELGI